MCLTIGSAILIPPRELWFLPSPSPPTQYHDDDTAIVGHVEGGREYRDLVGNFVKWCGENYLQLNVAKTKEMVVDFRRNKPLPIPF